MGYRAALVAPAIWFMSGATRLDDGYPGGTDPSGAWSIQGVGDFDADGRADILWRDTIGQLAIWFEGNHVNTAYPGYSNTPSPVDLYWQVSRGAFSKRRRNAG